MVPCRRIGFRSCHSHAKNDRIGILSHEADSFLTFLLCGFASLRDLNLVHLEIAGDADEPVVVATAGQERQVDAAHFDHADVLGDDAVVRQAKDRRSSCRRRKRLRR